MSHFDVIHKNHDVLSRCITINHYVIDFLRAEDVLNEIQESDLKTERNPLKQRSLLLQWLKEVPISKYGSFLKVMMDTEQEHVANLLTGSTEVDHLPLSDERYTRLVKIRAKIAKVIRIDNEVIPELRSSKAISMTDAEEIRAEKDDFTKISTLISAIMRRSNHSYNSFQEALRKTQQMPAADYLNEGEMPAVHVNNNRSDLDGPLARALNHVIMNGTTDDTTIKGLFAEMEEHGLHPVKAIPGNSIVIFIYCKTVQNAVTFTELYNSGRLQCILEGILNRLLQTIEPHNTDTLDSRISLEDEESITLEEFTGIEGWMTESLTRPKLSRKKYGHDADTQTDEESFFKTETATSHELYWRQERRAFYQTFEILLTEEEELLNFFLPATPPLEEDQNWKQRRTMLIQPFKPLLNTQNNILKSLITRAVEFKDIATTDELSCEFQAVKAELKKQKKSWKCIKTEVLLEGGEQLLSSFEFPQSAALSPRGYYESEFEIAGALTDDAIDLLLQQVRQLKQKLKERNETTDKEDLFLTPINLSVKGKEPERTKDKQQRSQHQQQFYQPKEYPSPAQKRENEKSIISGQRGEKREFKSESTNRSQLDLKQPELSESLKSVYKQRPSHSSYLQRRDATHTSKMDPGISLFSNPILEGPHSYGHSYPASSSRTKLYCGYSLPGASTEMMDYFVREARLEMFRPYPLLVATITIKAVEGKRKWIRGLTILNKELFVLSGQSSEVEVYDSMKFSFRRRWNLEELIRPLDVGSCNQNKCLYISDYKGDDKPKEILRVDLSGKLIKIWSTGDDYGESLSVSDESNVILTVSNKNKLNEYSPDGQLIREVSLSIDVGIQNLWHAVKLTNGDFVVSHGLGFFHLHRVCVVDGDGKLKKSIGRTRGSTIGQMNHPISFAVDGNGFLMVADKMNGRVLSLDSDLEFKREILSKDKHGLRRPQRILLDESNNRLLVADNKWDSEKKTLKDGHILIFQLS